MNIWKRIKVVKAYKDFFSSESGKVILADLMRECRLMKNTYKGNSEELLFNEGKRNVLLYILSHINVDLAQLTDIARQSQGADDE